MERHPCIVWSLLAVVLAAASLLSAPVPKELDRELPPLTPGVYTIQWAGTPFVATLGADGEFFESGGGKSYRGLWTYCHRTRTLGVDERCEVGGTRWVWSVKLDDKMAGTTCGGVAVRRPAVAWPCGWNRFGFRW